MEIIDWQSGNCLQKKNFPVQISKCSIPIFRGSLDDILRQAKTTRVDSIVALKFDTEHHNQIEQCTNYDNVYFCSPLKGVNLPLSKISIISYNFMKVQNTVSITVQAENGSAAFVWIDSFEFEGTWSDNAFFLKNNERFTVYFSPKWNTIIKDIYAFISSLQIRSIADTILKI